MKTTTNIFVFLFLITMLVTQPSAQGQQTQTKEEWQHKMQQATMTRDELKNQVGALEKEVETLQQRDASLAASVQKCRDELLGLLGRTEAQEKNFSALLDQIDSRLNDLEKLSNGDLWMRRDQLDSIQAAITGTKKRPLALIPENSARLDNQQHRLDQLRASLHEPKEHQMTYVVGTWRRERDCLWNISKKPGIYDNPFLWPKIWQENREQIKNPDIIHTGQRLMIPPKAPLTHPEKVAEQMYWKDKLKGKGSLSSTR